MIEKNFWNSRLNFSYRSSEQFWKQNTISNWRYFFLYQLHAFKNIWMIQVTNFKFSIAIVIVNSALQLSKKVFSDLQDFFIFFFIALFKSCMLTRLFERFRSLKMCHNSGYFFSNFSCMFLNPNIFSNMNHNCSNLSDMRNLQEQVKKAFCYQELFWLSLFE